MICVSKFSLDSEAGDLEFWESISYDLVILWFYIFTIKNIHVWFFKNYYVFSLPINMAACMHFNENSCIKKSVKISLISFPLYSLFFLTYCNWDSNRDTSFLICDKMSSIIFKRLSIPNCSMILWYYYIAFHVCCCIVPGECINLQCEICFFTLWKDTYHMEDLYTLLGLYILLLKICQFRYVWFLYDNLCV